ncbi:hypothetical protein C8F01DRAFT_1125583 [Mycena amicta]|nr:hypothetical protein C8F01DRAFT_1125583 [Mycena amicta]
MQATVRISASAGLSALAVILALANVWLSMRSSEPPTTTERQYTYLGTDFPEFYIPTDGPLTTVAMAMEDSVHYGVRELSAKDEWASNSPAGYGYVRLGSEFRGFSIAMWHEMHCLHIIRLVLSRTPEENRNKTHTVGHMKHCLNYIRQFVMCNPSLHLEPVGWMDRNWDEQTEERDPEGATHVCQDWTQLYGEMADNWARWEPVRDMYNLNSTQPTMGPT